MDATIPSRGGRAYKLQAAALEGDGHLLANQQHPKAKNIFMTPQSLAKIDRLSDCRLAHILRHEITKAWQIRQDEQAIFVHGSVLRNSCTIKLVIKRFCHLRIGLFLCRRACKPSLSVISNLFNTVSGSAKTFLLV